MAAKTFKCVGCEREVIVPAEFHTYGDSACATRYCSEECFNDSMAGVLSISKHKACGEFYFED